MARTRLDPLDTARVIIRGCLQRDAVAAGDSTGDPGANSSLHFGRYREHVPVAPARRDVPHAAMVQATAPVLTLRQRAITVAVFAALACVAAVVWLCALLTVRG